ncbi:MAG: enoyl-CoA hydratase/isomerase family protein [Phycisphaerales bacterium]
MSLQRLPFERDGDDERGVVTLWLEQADRPVVVLDSDLLKAIDATLDEIGADIGGLVLASRSRVFVAGANLGEIMELSDEELHEYLAFGSRVFGRFATLPCTTVAAINGAALGGGLEIAMHCDHLIASRPASSSPEKPVKPYMIGLPEAGLSICPGWGGTCLLPARMAPERAIRATASGQPMTVYDASEAGLIEELVDGEGFMERARELAATPKAEARTEPISVAESSLREAGAKALKAIREDLPDTQAARAVASCVEAGVSEGWEACLAAERDSLVRLRGTDEGRAAIAAFFEKSGGRR